MWNKWSVIPHLFQKILKGNSLNGNHLNQKISWDLQILKLILWHS